MARKDMQLLIAKAIPRVGMVTDLAQIRHIFGGGRPTPCASLIVALSV